MRLELAQWHIYYLMRHLVGRRHIVCDNALSQRKTKVQQCRVVLYGWRNRPLSEVEFLKSLDVALLENKNIEVDDATQRATVRRELMTLMLS